MDTDAIMAAAKERVMQAGDVRGLGVLLEEMKAHHANAPVQREFCCWLKLRWPVTKRQWLPRAPLKL
jgi:hypothetical protein